MDITRLRIPMSVLIATLGIAAGSGGTVAVATAKQSEQTEQIGTLQREAQQSRERLVRIETLIGEMSKTLERIDKKLK